MKEIKGITLGENSSIIKSEFEYSQLIAINGCWYPINANQHDIPGKLKEWRKYRGITLRQVEKDTGVSNAYLSQIETGKCKRPSFDVVVKLCEYYLVHVSIR